MKEADAVRQELSRILDSRLFEGKKQASNFLIYTVEETLTGRGDKITQYGIAIDALGKTEDYCPTENPAVRVEAGRVRKLLDEYYSSEGKSNPIRILLPIGSYQPTFEQTRPPASLPNALQGFETKSIQSLGPKVYIHCQNPALIRNDSMRGLVYSIRSTLPKILGHSREMRIALGTPGQVQASQIDAIDYARQQQQTEFLLQCAAELEKTDFSLRFTLIHTLTRETVWSNTLILPQSYTQEMLEAVFGRLVVEAFSLHRGVALLFWSRYWKERGNIPSHYQVLVEHIHFIQDGGIGQADIQPFLQACQTRTQSYHDDAMAYLHYAILCLYAYMLRLDIGGALETQWNRLAVRALELNPGNALAHVIYALECYHRGDAEMGQVEIETACRISPFGCTSDYLLAVGLCALGHWEKALTLPRDTGEINTSAPDPLRAIPCLFYFKRGEFARIAKSSPDFQILGGWETFGKMASSCQQNDCKACIEVLNNTVDRVTVTNEGNMQSASDFWESIHQRLTDAYDDE